jgi:hypothetical protein
MMDKAQKIGITHPKSCVSRSACFRQKGGIEAAQATRKKWIEEEHKKISDSAMGNLHLFVLSSTD